MAGRGGFRRRGGVVLDDDDMGWFAPRVTRLDLQHRIQSKGRSVKLLVTGYAGSRRLTRAPPVNWSFARQRASRFLI